MLLDNNNERTELTARPYYQDKAPASVGGAPINYPLRLELKTLNDSPAYVLNFTRSEVEALLAAILDNAPGIIERLKR
mgnify:CR=1 FL=1